eukprot:CAMPEP_0181229894 /NCGR_PEP_ID=MMETSP1096-20121128/34155_1 /TAXON_ID=156174 ORGANISM="Chrysochromulina ericina, Strain CCMP281" /NCGR_SAMPLE_ID=MMETSP1096 /ASSEMBLY_ACC=CAM_ASM_000453 /LENGTH=73 /DNA_ID=CAMNT_0023323577 /DNA_START=197 /DNA_END=418 /DNA_ORIENTATION=+
MGDAHVDRLPAGRLCSVMACDALGVDRRFDPSLKRAPGPLSTSFVIDLAADDRNHRRPRGAQLACHTQGDPAA